MNTTPITYVYYMTATTNTALGQLSDFMVYRLPEFLRTVVVDCFVVPFAVDNQEALAYTIGVCWAKSSAVLHTYPERNLLTLTIELSEAADSRRLLQFIRDHFKPDQLEYHTAECSLH